MEVNATLSNVGMPACAVDRHHRVVSWNEAASEFFRLPADRVLGREWHTVVRTVNMEGCCGLCQTRAALRSGRSVMPIYATLSIDGYHERTVMVPTPGADDGICFIILTSLDLNGQASPTPISSRVRHLNDDRIIDELTPREREVLRCVVEGYDARTIAAEVGITHATARNYVQRILSKLGVRNKAEAVSIALTYNLLAS